MRALALISAAFLFLARPAFADVAPVASLAKPLDSVGVSARALAMGSAFVGVAQGSTALFWNPAGLSGLENIELGLHHSSWLAGIIQETAVVGVPLGRLGGLGLSVNYVNYGAIPGYDDNGAKQADYSSNRYGFAGGWGVEVLGGLSVGAALKGEVQSVADASYSSLAVDLGLRWDLTPDLRLGAAYTGLGTQVADYSQTADLSAGLSYTLHPMPTNQLLLATSATFEPQGVNRLQFGVEDLIHSFLALRAGYQASQTDTRLEGLSGLTLGVGFMADSFSLDYAYLPFGDLGSAQRLSLGYRFGH